MRSVTQSIISVNVAKLDKLMDLVGEMVIAEALNKIVDSVAKAATLVGSIAMASNEQATGISQVNMGIMQVSEVIQTNPATSEESAAASEELSSQAEVLKDIVGKFKLKKAATPSYGKLDELSPELLKMLENMSGRKRSIVLNEAEVRTPRKIALSNIEFGKY